MRVERKEHPPGERRQDPAFKDPRTCTGLPGLARTKTSRGRSIKTLSNGMLYNFDRSSNVRRRPPESPRHPKEEFCSWSKDEKWDKDALAKRLPLNSTGTAMCQNNLESLPRDITVGKQD
eukprot:scaffold1_cov375-Pavlova_lutheri.AAC.19